VYDFILNKLLNACQSPQYTLLQTDRQTDRDSIMHGSTIGQKWVSPSQLWVFKGIPIPYWGQINADDF